MELMQICLKKKRLKSTDTVVNASLVIYLSLTIKSYFVFVYHKKIPLKYKGEWGKLSQ